MRAVNLIPDASRRGAGTAPLRLSPGYLVLGVLAVALVMVTVYVLAANSISERRAKLDGLKQQVTQEQAAAARLSNYTKFAQLAEARAATVRQIAATRFDWHAALSNLSKVMPTNASLQSLVATVSPTSGVGSAGSSSAGAGSSSGGAGSSSLRGAIAAPAFVMAGCTDSQDDVARLISRLRLMDGVTRVSLGDASKPDSGSAGASSGTVSAGGAGGSTSGGCGANKPSFDLVVFFQPPAGSSSSLGSQLGTGAATNTGASSTAAGVAGNAGQSSGSTTANPASPTGPTAVSGASTGGSK